MFSLVSYCIELSCMSDTRDIIGSRMCRLSLTYHNLCLLMFKRLKAYQYRHWQEEMTFHCKTNRRKEKYCYFAFPSCTSLIVIDT